MVYLPIVLNVDISAVPSISFVFDVSAPVVAVQVGVLDANFLCISSSFSALLFFHTSPRHPDVFSARYLTSFSTSDS